MIEPMTTTAWYILPSKRRWARWVNVLHLPYSAWHLSYVVIGAMLAETISWPLLGWTVLAFFLGMGVAAHCFDLIEGDPLKLEISKRHLVVVGLTSILAAMGIGAWQIEIGNVPYALWPVVFIGLFLAVGYNLEWPGMHGDWQFATWWAVFPLLVSYFAQGSGFHPAIILVAGFASSSAMAQRVLSTRARFLRRHVENADCRLYGPYDQELNTHPWDGVIRTKIWLLSPLDLALQYLNGMMVALAVGLVLYRLWG